MSHLPAEVLNGLWDARRNDRRKRSRLRVQSGDQLFPVIGLRANGFVVDPESVPHLRGLVDLYDGARHVASCLIVASAREGDLRVYEYKRRSLRHEAPPADYVLSDGAPIALLN